MRRFGTQVFSQGSLKLNLEAIVPLNYIEYGVYGDLIMMYPKPYSIYLRGTINPIAPDPLATSLGGIGFPCYCGWRKSYPIHLFFWGDYSNLGIPSGP